MLWCQVGLRTFLQMVFYKGISHSLNLGEMENIVLKSRGFCFRFTCFKHILPLHSRLSLFSHAGVFVAEAASLSSQTLPADFFSGPGWATFSLTGERHIKKDLPNQDSVLLVPSFLGESGRTLFALCDGHGRDGHLCAQRLLDHLPTNLPELAYTQDPSKALKEFCRVQDRYLEDRLFHGGTTLVIADVSPQRILIAHVGDSRATMVTSHHRMADLTVDHHVSLIPPQELEALQRRGGMVVAIGKKRTPFLCAVEEDPIYIDIHTLTTYRSIGDYHFGRGPSSTPDVQLFSWDQLSQGTHLLLWSDGACGAISETAFSSSVIRRIFHPSSIEEISLRLREEIVRAEPFDDATAMVVDLSSFRPPS